MLIRCGLLGDFGHRECVTVRTLNLLRTLSHILFIHFDIALLTISSLNLSLLDDNRLLTLIDHRWRHSWILLCVDWDTLWYIDLIGYIKTLSCTLRVNDVRILILGFDSIYKSRGMTH